MGEYEDYVAKLVAQAPPLTDEQRQQLLAIFAPQAAPAADHEMTVSEAAKYRRVSAKTIYGWIQKGILPAHRFGPQRLYIWRSDLDAMAKDV
ncbi:helix-turn-helix domain-containing protein [Microbacterium gilvum]|uniref:Helix-turn-helix domain-containing protein n=1 Tax=Microbacterium gilvum TaxID=1336204 RepID=A0ABP9A584_9MICO